MVSSPVRTQVRRSPPAEPVWREISAATMKMPEPIIDPTTIIVPSNKPMARTKPCSLAALAEIAWVLSAIRHFPHSSLDARRVVRSFQNFDELKGARSRIPRAENIANRGNRIRPSPHDFRGAFQRDSANRHDGFVRKRPNLPEE